ncbi:MAG TPA: hypothetical protein VF791_23760 [Pyrinomonadaceae bacterium]
MTQQQFEDEIRRLSIEDRIALIEAISRSLREDMKTRGGETATPEKEMSAAENEHERRIAAVRRLRGIIKFEGAPPSDEELKEDYTKYLIEKYS